MHTPHPHPRRLPFRLLAVVALVALLVLAGVLGWAAWQFAQLPPIVAGVLRIALFTSPLVAGGVGLAIAWRRWASVELLKADRVVALTQAQVQRFPAALTSLSFHDSSKPQLTPELPALPEPAPETARQIPTFAQLLDQGKIGTGRPLLLGFDAATGQAIEGGWDLLYSCGIGALQGAGKSWLAAFLLAQSAAQGGRLIVCDLHAGNSESLATRIEALSPAFMCDIASTPDAILSALKLADGKLQQRIDGRGGQWEIIIAIDEYTSLLRTKVGAMLPDFLENVAEQGRKYHVNALLSAQGWTKDAAGDVRNRLTSHYVMRQRPDEARWQLGLRAGQMPLDLIGLPPATAYLLDTRGNLVRVQIPLMTSHDLARVGAMIAAPANVQGQPFGLTPAPVLASTARAQEASGKPTGSGLEAKRDVASTAPGSAGSLSPEAALLRAELLAGKTVSEAARERNGGSTSGRNYQAALNDVNELLRQLLGGN